MISQQVRTNAIITYFFLGWIFLLAKRNPNFSDPFIRYHAKSATRLHLVFFVSYFIYSHFASRFLMYPVPLVNMTIDRLVSIGAFCLLTFLILLGAYRAGNSDSVDNPTRAFENPDNVTDSEYRYEGAGEQDRVTFLLSYIPFIGTVFAERYPNIITRFGANIGTLFGTMFIAYISLATFDSLSMIALFGYILFVAMMAGQFFLKDTCSIPRALIRLPSIEDIWIILRALPGYTKSVLSVTFGTSESLSYLSHIERIKGSDVAFSRAMNETFSDTSITLPRWLIFIPIVNILYIPKLFISRNIRYVIAIGQGLVVTLLAIGFYFLDDSRLQSLLLIPMFLGTSHIFSDPFYRLPIVYELYVSLNTITFWLLENTRKLKETREKEQSVSFKVR